MSTNHIAAKVGDIANVVLMPGDPWRAKMIADNFLHDVKLVNEWRAAFCYTGLTKNGKRVSVMASGMGMPSIGIYSHELFTGYDVDVIIRVGTCGTYQKSVGLTDIILAQACSTDSNWMGQFNLAGTFSATADFHLLQTAYEASKKAGKTVHVGSVLSADVFYDHDHDTWKRWAELGILGVEMESYALYAEAATNHKKALCILTVSDTFVGEGKLTAEERQYGLGAMIEIAIDTAEKYAK